MEQTRYLAFQRSTLLLRIQVFCDVTPYLLVNTDISKYCNSFVTSVINYQFTQINIAEDLYLRPLHIKIFTMKLNSNFSDLSKSADLWQSVQVVKRRLQKLDKISNEM